MSFWTPRGELESVLAQKKALEEQQAQLLARPQPQLLEALPRLPELVRDRVDDLISCLSGGRLLQGRSMLDMLVDEITVKPGDTKEGRPCHIVRVRGALDRAFGLLSPRRQMSVVAGAGFVALEKTRTRRWIWELPFDALGRVLDAFWEEAKLRLMPGATSKKGR
jgi:hypothetical protein